jgi:hypothetical protein
MKNIQIQAMASIDKTSLLCSKDANGMVDHYKNSLARQLAQFIVVDKRFFEQVDTKYSVEITANMYVLTPSDFYDLVNDVKEKIRDHKPICNMGGINGQLIDFH